MFQEPTNGSNGSVVLLSTVSLPAGKAGLRRPVRVVSERVG
jgi:hypothetical protein